MINDFILVIFNKHWRCPRKKLLFVFIDEMIKRNAYLYFYMVVRLTCAPVYVKFACANIAKIGLLLADLI